MRIAIFSDRQRHDLLEQLLHGLQLPGIPACTNYPTYDELISGLPKNGCDLLIVAQDGASGMEGARAAKVLLPDVPLIWFSDDNGFGPESYRVGCAFFCALPITKERLCKALTTAKLTNHPQGGNES